MKGHWEAREREYREERCSSLREIRAAAVGVEEAVGRFAHLEQDSRVDQSLVVSIASSLSFFGALVTFSQFPCWLSLYKPLGA